MGIPKTLGMSVPIKFGSTFMSSYDDSGTAYLPNVETSVVVNCAFLSDKSTIFIVPINAASGVVPLVEIVASRTYGSNGTFTVKKQNAAAASADLYFAWLVIN